MKSSIIESLPAIGTAMGGGFFLGAMREGDSIIALIAAPKAEGQIILPWNESEKLVEGALSYADGMTNTLAMAAAGSELAKWARALRIGGFNDWFIPAQDELEIAYRHLKPTTEKNWQYARSGINLAALVPTRPYTADEPAQTGIELFQAGGVEAFEAAYHWTSTQRAGHSASAWGQDFSDGFQGYGRKSYSGHARAVRRLIIQ